MHTIVTETTTLLSPAFCGAAERFQIESVRNFTVSASVWEEVVVAAISVQAKSETTTCNRVWSSTFKFSQRFDTYTLKGKSFIKEIELFEVKPCSKVPLSFAIEFPRTPRVGSDKQL